MLTAGAAKTSRRVHSPKSLRRIPLTPTLTPTRPFSCPPPACVRSEKLDKQLAEQQTVVTARRGEALKAQQEAQAAQAALAGGAAGGGGGGGGGKRGEDE